MTSASSVLDVEEPKRHNRLLKASNPTTIKSQGHPGGPQFSSGQEQSNSST